MKEINEVLQEAESENIKIKKKNKQFAKHSVIYFVLVCIVLACVGFLSYKNQTDNAKASKNEFSKSLKAYEESTLGNFNDNTLQTGRFLKINNDLYTSYGGYIYKNQTKYLKLNASYLNRYNNGIICRNNDTGCVTYITDDGQVAKDESQAKVGELLIVKNDLYYINLDDGSLCKEDMEKTKATKICDNCKKFAIRELFLYLITNSNTLYKINLNTYKITNQISNVIDFTFGSQYLYVFNGKSIYTYDWDLNKVSKVIDKASYMIGTADSGIVYGQNHKVYVNKEVIAENIDFCQVCYEDDGRYYLIVRSIDNDSKENLVYIVK